MEDLLLLLARPCVLPLSGGRSGSFYSYVRFYFERLDQGGGIFFSETKSKGRGEISSDHAQRGNRRLQTVTKSFNQTNILEHEFQREAGRKIAVQNVLTIAHEQRRTKVSDLQNFHYRIQIKSGFPRQDQAFRERLQFQRDDEISHQLHGCGISIPAKVMNTLPQMPHDRFYFLKDGLVARAYNPELGLGGFPFTTKDRRIEKIDTALCISFLFSQTHCGKDRAHVHRDLAFADSTQDSFSAKDNFLDRLIVTQTVHHKLGAADRVCGSIRHAHAFPSERFTFFAAPIPHRKLIAG